MAKSMNLWVILVSLILFGVVVFLLITRGTEPPELTEIKGKLRQYAPVTIKPNLSGLSANQKTVLKLLIQAAEINDTVFWKQSCPNGLDLHKILSDSNRPIDKYYLEYLNINYGPFDRREDNKPFYGEETKPRGAGFYPPDTTVESFNTYLDEHPEQKEELTSLYTIVKKTKDGGFKAVPYSKAFAEETKKIHELLLKASENAKNKSLKAYLKAKAEDFLEDEFYNSDTLWLKLKDNDIDLVIGPQEVYEDTLFNYKAAHEAFVLLKDREESKKLEVFNEHKNALERNLPVPEDYRKEYKGLSSPLAVAQLIYCSGDTNAGTKTIAFNLPNDEQVREEFGSKKVLLKNVIDAKYEKILVPIAQTLLETKLQRYLSKEAFSTNVLMHEFSHAFGLNFTVSDSTLSIKKALGASYSTIEECKADVLGLYNQSYFFKNGIIDKEKLYSYQTTFIASIFRSIRFGAHEAHGGANLIQFNFLTKYGAISYNKNSGKYDIDFSKMESGIAKLSEFVLKIQGDGDANAATGLIEKYGKMTPQLEASLGKLKSLPVDIVFHYNFGIDL